MKEKVNEGQELKSRVVRAILKSDINNP